MAAVLSDQWWNEIVVTTAVEAGAWVRQGLSARPLDPQPRPQVPGRLGHTGRPIKANQAGGRQDCADPIKQASGAAAHVKH